MGLKDWFRAAKVGKVHLQMQLTEVANKLHEDHEWNEQCAHEFCSRIQEHIWEQRRFGKSATHIANELQLAAIGECYPIIYDRKSRR